MAELVDAHDSKSCAFGRAGSIPALGTKRDSASYPFSFVLNPCAFGLAGSPPGSYRGGFRYIKDAY